MTGRRRSYPPRRVTQPSGPQEAYGREAVRWPLLRRVTSSLVLVIAISGPAACASRSGPTAVPAPRPPASQVGQSSEAGPGTNPTAAENARTGTTAWRLSNRGPEHAIEGYADRASVLPGESFQLYVSTTATGFYAVAYRMGWYGGRRGREVWRSHHVRGYRQLAATVELPLNTVTANWQPSLVVHTAGWPEGDYLIKLTSDRGAERYVPITVRSRTTSGKVVLLNSVATWQAYNTWGGYDLYTGPTGFSDRSRAVSFDRPYDRSGATMFLTYEQPAIVTAERLGLPLAYLTDTDLAAQPGILRGARALITLGHAEYWSRTMRWAAAKARDSGTNLAFLGADAINRHIRFEATPLGPNRLVVCYKSADEDPVARTDPADSTQDWRMPPDPRPESALVGVLYDCFPVDEPFVVTDSGSWVFAGTDVRTGMSFPGLVGPESDRLDPRLPTPRPIEVLSHVSYSCDGRPTWSNAAYYTARSGAGVFSTGTMRWVRALDRSPSVAPEAWPFVQRVTANVLRAFAVGPCGQAHPAHDNTARLPELSHG